MITDDMIMSVSSGYNISASRLEIRRILERFESLLAMNKSKALELRPNESVFVTNSYAGDEDEFDSIDKAVKHIQDQVADRGWDEDDVADNIKVIIGREVSVDCEKTFTVKFS
jgi:hypothetical protein